MIAFEVSLNGNRVCVAGAEDLAVLTAGVTAFGKLGKKTIRPGADETSDITCTVGGMTGRPNPEKDVYIIWAAATSLQVGDVLQIKVIETDKADRAKSRKNVAQNRHSQE